MSKFKLTEKSMVEVSSFKTNDGDLFINLRKFYMDKEGEWKPTKQGISIPESKAKKLLKYMKEELENIEDNAVELELKGKSKNKAKGKGKRKSKDEDEDDDNDE